MAAASATGTKNVREVHDLQFKDGSHYAGQALEGYSGAVPYGYGVMTTKEGFRVSGLFKDGKSQGEGIFLAPNGDAFYGQWNKDHKRHGKGLSIRASDATICVEEYDDGKMLKKVKRRPPVANTLYWLPPLNLPGVDERHKFTGDVPGGHAGHSTNVTRDGGLVIVFGGEVTSKDSTLTQVTNDVYILDVKSRVWVKPHCTGTIPPPMQGHTATLVGRQLVIIGGQVGGLEASSSVYVLDIESGVWTTPVTKGLSFLGHSATLIGTKEIWVIVQSSVFVLTMNHSTHWEWKEVATDNRSLPRQVPRSFANHSAVAVGTMIYVYGGKWLGLQHGEGKKYERLSHDVRILHTESLSWEAPTCTAPVIPATAASTTVSDYSGFVRGAYDVPRCEHTATLVGNLMYIIGGWTTSNPSMNVVDTCYLNDVQILDVETMSWQYVPPFPLFIAPRSLHTVIHLGDELWTFGGRNSATTSLNEWNILHLPQSGGSSATTAPAPVKKAAAPAAKATGASSATTSTASTASATTQPTSAPMATSQLQPQPHAPPPDESGEMYDQSSVGSGDILADFLKQGK